MRSKARQAAAASQEKAPIVASAHAVPAPPATTKKQRSIHDFFAQDIVRETARKKREPAAASRIASADVEPVMKRIDYDSSSSGGMDDESSEANSASQTSEVAFDNNHQPKPKKIDFSSQRSEPDGEPNEIPGSGFGSGGGAFGGRSVVSSQQGLFLENLSAPHFSRMYSQDEMDFLTPLDQPVMHLSHPTTPSPLKKRQRRNDDEYDGDGNAVGFGVDRIREEEVQNLTQDMTHMDVCHRMGVQPPPSFSSDSMPSPRHFLQPTPHKFTETPAKSFLPGKRRSRPNSNEGTSSKTSFLVMESFVNPFAPTPASDLKKKRSNRKRQSFPTTWGSGLNTAPLSKYLADFSELELIGSGSFSKVFKCMKKIDGWMYAVKKSKRHFRGKADTERALREVQALAALSSSRHVVRYFDAWIEDDLLYIQLESCSGCSLGGFLDKFKPHHIPEAVLCKVLCHITQALHDMHSKKMVHMDVKIQNVLVADGEIYKLGDLGTVAHMDGSMEITEGDNRYLSRELMEGSRTNLRAGDIFALGATIYELALGATLPNGGEDWQRIRDGDLVMFRSAAAAAGRGDFAARGGAAFPLIVPAVFPFDKRANGWMRELMRNIHGASKASERSSSCAAQQTLVPPQTQLRVARPPMVSAPPAPALHFRSGHETKREICSSLAMASTSAAQDAAPYEFPSLTEIKRALPSECFEASVPLSLYYTARSLALAGSLAVALSYARALPLVQANALLDATLCTGYVLLQGIVFWGFFTVGHDCGHGAFSRSHVLNFSVGTLMHSIILTPFESWKLSHRHHHKNTGNIDKDEIFYPQREADSHPVSRHLVMSLGSAWFAYLFAGFPPRTMNHFNPWEAMYVRRVAAVIISLGVLFAFAGLYSYLTFVLGFTTMAIYYFGPLFVFATMLVVTTFLTATGLLCIEFLQHHNDEETPWYADSEWTYVKGNLSSVDRSYGALIDNLSHNIGTHQIHHLFPIIPHYKLNDATAAFAKAFPELVRKNAAPIIPTFFRMAAMYAKYGVVDTDAKTFTLKEAKAAAKTKSS